MDISISTSVQSNYLTEAKNLQTPMIVYMMNGFQVRGTIIDFDDFTILVESDGKKQLLYKHAVSTVAPFIQRPDLRSETSGYKSW